MRKRILFRIGDTRLGRLYTMDRFGNTILSASIPSGYKIFIPNQGRSDYLVVPALSISNFFLCIVHLSQSWAFLRNNSLKLQLLELQ
jgi:hypothetical protein